MERGEVGTEVVIKTWSNKAQRKQIKKKRKRKESSTKLEGKQGFCKEGQQVRQAGKRRSQDDFKLFIGPWL